MNIGYYDTWDEAWEACKEVLKVINGGHYKVDECLCGKFYYWVEESK